jgi:hypothetical protein
MPRFVSRVAALLVVPAAAAVVAPATAQAEVVCYVHAPEVWAMPFGEPYTVCYETDPPVCRVGQPC